MLGRTASLRGAALHPPWDDFFLEAGFRASPSVYDTLSIVLQHLLWKKIVVVWLKQKYKNSQLQKVI